MRFSDVPIIDIPGITLRPVELADIPTWYEYLSLPKVVEHTSWNLKSAEDLRPLIESYNSDDLSSEIRFAIQAEFRAPLVGTIGFHTVSPVNRMRNLRMTFIHLCGALESRRLVVAPSLPGECPSASTCESKTRSSKQMRRPFASWRSAAYHSKGSCGAIVWFGERLVISGCMRRLLSLAVPRPNARFDSGHRRSTYW